MLRKRNEAISPDVTVVSEGFVAGATKEKIADQILKFNHHALVDVRDLVLRISNANMEMLVVYGLRSNKRFEFKRLSAYPSPSPRH